MVQRSQKLNFLINSLKYIFIYFLLNVSTVFRTNLLCLSILHFSSNLPSSNAFNKKHFAPSTQSKKLCNAFYLTLLYSSLLVPLEVGRTIRFLPRETLDPFLRFYIYIFIFYILYLSKIQLRARSH